MKKELAMWLVVILVLVGVLFGTRQETMAIEFDGTTSKYLAYHPLGTGFGNLDLITVSAWIYSDTYNTASGNIWFHYGSSFTTNSAVPNAIKVIWATTGTAGIWDSPASSITTGAWHHVLFTLDRTDVANNPIIYINGTSVAVTETQTPTGAKVNETDDNLAYIGYEFDGKISDVRIYNRILTAAEVAQIYSARGRDNIRSGLVFCPFLNGAAGLQAFDGATLAAGNTIVDPCSGAVGVPAGSPVGVGETYLR